MARELRWRRSWIAALAGLLALGPAVGAAGGTALAAAPAAPAAHARAAVPWRQVGPGWVLAIEWPGKFGFPGQPRAAVPVLYLFSPAGGRYRLFRWPRTKRPPVLLDWSGDKARALVSTSRALEQVVLATGKIRPIHLPGQEQIIGYTRPTGQGLLSARPVGSELSHFRLSRYHLDGRLAKVLTSVADGITTVYSNSGAVLVINAPHGIWLVSNNGGIRRRVHVPGAGAGCRPARWLNSGTILASCKATSKSRRRLWLVPAHGGEPRPLTAQHSKSSVDPGDFDAWRLRDSVYLNSQAHSGRELIFRKSAGRPLEAVPVPHVPSSDAILAARGSRLLIVAFGLCSEHSSLLWLNPVTGKEQPLINTRPALAGVLGAVPFGPATGIFSFDVACAGVRRMDRL
jgi:hypothetical protein